MSKKPPQKSASPKAQNPFIAAVEKADLTGVRELLAAGHKPDAAAARQAVDACVKASGTARMRKRPLFGRMPSKQEQEKAGADADLYYDIASALLHAGAPVPEALCPAAGAGHIKLALLLIRHGSARILWIRGPGMCHALRWS